MQENNQNSSVVSPFSDSEGHPIHKTRKKTSLGLWISLSVFLIVILGVTGIVLARFLNDPLRTLEPLPVGKYMESYKSLAGSKFRANLRVENDLGWKEGIGRLMVFSLQEDSRPIVVMIPAGMSQIHFTKGQTYVGELEVKEGGLVYANSIRKD